MALTNRGAKEGKMPRLMTTTALSTLLWMEQGQTLIEATFYHGSHPSQRFQYLDVQSAAQEAMRRLSDGSSLGRQPWILSEGVILEPDEIQMIYNDSVDPMHAIIHY
jgi:hypothetical protein